MLMLKDIVGQDRAVGQLQQITAGQRRPHALIFAGPEGVGRKTTARALAAALLCRGGGDAGQGLLGGMDAPPVGAGACGGCDSCRAIAAGTHPDYHEVRKELARYSDDDRTRNSKMQDLSIQVVREFLIAPAERHSSMGQGRFFLIAQAELLNPAAQNALLKTLEEPPPKVTIVLSCPSPASLLPTIRSRCALVRFGPLPRAFVTERLLADGLDSEEADFWARYTDGSVGVSARLARLGLYPTKRELIERLVPLRETLDADLSDWLLKKVDDLAGAIQAEDRQLSATLVGRQAAGMLIGLIASAYRDAMALAGGAEQLRVHADQPESIRQLARGLACDQAAEVIDQLAGLERLLWRNLNSKTIWENVVITCAQGIDLGV